jgi:hypothetical protein
MENGPERFISFPSHGWLDNPVTGLRIARLGHYTPPDRPCQRRDEQADNMDRSGPGGQIRIGREVAPRLQED